MVNGAQSHGVVAAVFDDFYHLSAEFVKVQFEYSPRELAKLAKGSTQGVWLIR